MWLCEKKNSENVLYGKKIEKVSYKYVKSDILFDDRK